MAYEEFRPVQMGQGAIPLTPTVTTFYPVPDNTRAILKTIDIGNTTTADITINLHLVHSGDSPTTANVLLPNIVIPATTIEGGVFQWFGSQILYAGDTIQITASAVGCTYNGSGGEAT